MRCHLQHSSKVNVDCSFSLSCILIPVCLFIQQSAGDISRRDRPPAGYSRVSCSGLNLKVWRLNINFDGSNKTPEDSSANDAVITAIFQRRCGPLSVKCLTAEELTGQAIRDEPESPINFFIAALR